MTSPDSACLPACQGPSEGQQQYSFLLKIAKTYEELSQNVENYQSMLSSSKVLNNRLHFLQGTEWLWGCSTNDDMCAALRALKQSCRCSRCSSSSQQQLLCHQRFHALMTSCISRRDPNHHHCAQPHLMSHGASQMSAAHSQHTHQGM
jgi:hypothetical protein